MPKIVPIEFIVDTDSEFKTIDRFASLKEYDNTWDLTNISVVHKLYNGTRITFDKMGKIVNKHAITKWGPFHFKCEGCGLTRNTYDMIVKHQNTCKKLVD